MRGIVLSSVSSAWVLATVIAGCSGGHGDTGSSSANVQFGGHNDSPTEIPGSSTLLSANISAADVNQTFGVDSNHVPYPDTYWPFMKGGTNAVWDQGSAPPIDKYMTTFDNADLQAARDWETNNHGPKVPNVADWWGHCPGWTGAAMAVVPIQHAVFAKSDGQGGVAPCSQGQQGCTRFDIGDIDALLAESFVDGNSTFIGNRCDTAPANIQRDQFGRIDTTKTPIGCAGLNAGTLMIALATEMKTNHRAMAIDAQFDFNTDQIWNQPAYQNTVIS
jgi:hypothetical protein